MKFKTLMVCTILCASIKNSLSYAIINDDRFDGSGDYDDNVEIIDNAVDHTDNYQVHTTDYPDKFIDDHNHDIENRFYKDHYDLYHNDDHHDIDTDDYYRHLDFDHNDLHDRCDVHNQHGHDRYDDDDYARTENNFPDWSDFYYKKRSVSGGPQPRSRNILVRQTHGQPHLKRDQLINKRRVMSFRGGQPISRSNLRPVHQIRAKRAMKKL